MNWADLAAIGRLPKETAAHQADPCLWSPSARARRRRRVRQAFPSARVQGGGGGGGGGGGSPERVHGGLWQSGDFSVFAQLNNVYLSSPTNPVAAHVVTFFGSSGML